MAGTTRSPGWCRYMPARRLPEPTAAGASRIGGPPRATAIMDDHCGGWRDLQQRRDGFADGEGGHPRGFSCRSSAQVHPPAHRHRGHLPRRQPCGPTANSNAVFRIKDGTPRLWDPVTGEIRSLPQFEQEGERTCVPLAFAPCQGYFIDFARDGSSTSEPSTTSPASASTAKTSVSYGARRERSK